ncbi:4226_t:CDS:2, partial [Dentiscutata erythropus]
MDSTFNSTIILNNSEISRQKSASSDTDSEVLSEVLSENFDEPDINDQKSAFHDFDYGTPDLLGLPDKIKKKIEHNVRNVDIEKIRKAQQKHTAPWGSDTPFA